jgi:hypothetical protein
MLRSADYIPLMAGVQQLLIKCAFPTFHAKLFNTILPRRQKRQKQQKLPDLGALKSSTEDDRDHVYDTIQEKPSVLIEDLLAEIDFEVHRLSIGV